MAAIVPAEDLEWLEAMEDRIDAEDARKAVAEMKAKGEKPIPLAKPKKKLGLRLLASLMNSTTLKSRPSIATTSRRQDGERSLLAGFGSFSRTVMLGLDSGPSGSTIPVR